jgi:hypothetical protein
VVRAVSQRVTDIVDESHKLLTTYYLLLTTYYLPPTTYNTYVVDESHRLDTIEGAATVPVVGSR